MHRSTPPIFIFLLLFALFSVQQGQVEKYNHPTRSVHREEAFSSSRTEAIHTLLAQKEPSIHSAHREESRIEPLSKTTAKASERKTKLPACLESTGVVRPEPPVHSSSASGHKFVLPIIHFVPKNSNLWRTLQVKEST